MYVRISKSDPFGPGITYSVFQKKQNPSFNFAITSVTIHRF